MEESLLDARLRQHVMEELAEDPQLDTANIRVQAVSGAIVLSGSVTSESQRQAAERDTWWVDTVRAVDNQLVLVFAHDEAHASQARGDSR
jgi:osmotically-inducible protein OsmY